MDLKRSAALATGLSAQRKRQSGQRQQCMVQQLELHQGNLERFLSSGLIKFLLPKYVRNSSVKRLSKAEWRLTPVRR